MTREEAILYLTTIAESASLERYKEALGLALSALQNQPVWIPVTERLPEKSGTYFVVTKTGAVTFARFYPEHDFKDCTGKFIRHEKGKFQSNRNVIYWMPLPEPPKEGANNG